MRAKKKRKLRCCISAVCILLALMLCVPFSRSLLVMGVYSGIQKRGSLLDTEGIDLKIPGGLTTRETDWYPFVMPFSADEAYGGYIGEPKARLTILYNFPAFSMKSGCSRLFDPDSQYYNGFYGAYLVRDSSNTALREGEIDEERLEKIVAYDYFHLVLEDFGLKKAEERLSINIGNREKDVSYLGYTGWERLTAEFTINGAAHNRRAGVTSYLQYGAPRFGWIQEEFALVTMQGIVYGRYFSEQDVGIYLYVMAQKQEICETCDQQILSKSSLVLP